MIIFLCDVRFPTAELLKIQALWKVTHCRPVTIDHSKLCDIPQCWHLRKLLEGRARCAFNGRRISSYLSLTLQDLFNGLIFHIEFSWSSAPHFFLSTSTDSDRPLLFFMAFFLSKMFLLCNQLFSHLCPRRTVFHTTRSSSILRRTVTAIAAGSFESFKS